jgi:hypothetical protein
MIYFFQGPKARKADIGVSITSVYNKLSGLETGGAHSQNIGRFDGY